MPRRSSRRLSSPSAIPDAIFSTARGPSKSIFRCSRASRFAEKRRVEFRAEAFNALNTPQFNNPNASIGFTGVGTNHQRRQPDGVPAHLAADPACSEAVLLALFFAHPAAGGLVSFGREVAPIFAMHCNGCHGDAGGLSLRSYKDLIKGGNLGVIVVPGNADGSLLIHFLDGRRGEAHRMPKEGRPLGRSDGGCPSVDK